mgnify:CR=1 FL=1
MNTNAWVSLFYPRIKNGKRPEHKSGSDFRRPLKIWALFKNALGKLCHSLLGAIIGFFVILQAGYLELLVENFMRQPLKTVSPEISIRNTAKAMLSEKIDALVIKDKSSGKHIEIVTNTDLADLAIAMEINPESPQLKK